MAYILIAQRHPKQERIFQQDERASAFQCSMINQSIAIDECDRGEVAPPTQKEDLLLVQSMSLKSWRTRRFFGKFIWQ